MKRWIVGTVIWWWCFCCSADTFRLDGLQGDPYRPQTNVVMTWAATNELPRGLWIYKAVPQEFSMAVVSNVMSICNFGWNNRRSRFDRDIADKNLISFTDKQDNWTRYLEIAPTLGWIEYNADSEVSTNEVPSKAEVRQLALDVLFGMGIDRSLVCDEHNGYQTVQGKLSRDGHRLTTNVVERGISFARQIDGIESKNSACFELIVEGDARIRRLLLNWRHLIPQEPHLVATPNEIMDSIRVGQATLPLQSGDVAGVDNARKLIITDVMLRYFDNKGSKPLDFSYPFAAVKVLANLDGTNTATFYLLCPILSTNQSIPRWGLKR